MDKVDISKQEDTIRGVAPHRTIDLECYHGQHIPANWEITGVSGDIIMAEYADVSNNNADYVDKGGIDLPTSSVKAMWRVCRIVKVGPGCSDQCKVGSYVMIPSDKGIPMTKFDGHNYIFINEERIFCFVEPK